MISSYFSRAGHKHKVKLSNMFVPLKNTHTRTQNYNTLMVSCLSHLLAVFWNLDVIDEMRIFGCVLCTYDSCILFINYVWASWLCRWSDLSISVALYTARVYGVCLWGHGTESMCMKARAWYLSDSQLPCQMLGWRGSWCIPALL